LVEEDWGAGAEEDVAVEGGGKVGVAEFEAVEFGAGDGLGGVVFLAEFGRVAVGDDG